MATAKQTRARTESAAFLAVVAGIVVLLNVLGVVAFGRFDVTEKRVFSLSEGSKQLVAGLDDQLEVVGYFSEDLPAPHNATERYVRDLLAEYQSASRGKLRVRFVHPKTDEERQQAEADGVVRVSDPSYQGDTFSVKEGYRGLVFRYLGESKKVPVIQTTAGLEYEITQIIKELAGERLKVGVLDKHEGPSLSEGLTAIKQLLRNYDFEPVDAGQPIASHYRALLIVQPESELSEAELRNIDEYVMRGGSLGVFGGTLKVELSERPAGKPVNSGLNRLLDKWGVQVDASLVADAQCGRARMPTRLGIPIAVPYPPVPVVSFDESQRKHPVLFNLDQVGLPYVSRLRLNDNLAGDPQVRRMVLARSTDNSWLLEGEDIGLEARAPNEWQMAGEPGPHSLAVALEGRLPSAFAAGQVSTPEEAAPPALERAERDARVLVVGGGFFLRDEFMPRAAHGMTPEMNSAVAFALNAIDWLAQDEALVAIRAKTVEDPTLEVPTNVLEAEASIRAAVEKQDSAEAQEAFERRKAAIAAWDAKKSRYRWSNTLAMPLFMVGFGLVRWQRRKNRQLTLQD